MLGWIGGKEAEEPYVTIGAFSTFWYFFHFLVILPVLSKRERALPRPESIDADYKAKH